MPFEPAAVVASEPDVIVERKLLIGIELEFGKLNATCHG
jgi:hypothetical protein